MNSQEINVEINQEPTQSNTMLTEDSDSDSSETSDDSQFSVNSELPEAFRNLLNEESLN